MKLKNTINFFSFYKVIFKSEWFLWTLLITIVFLIINNKLLLGTAVGVWDADGIFVPNQIMVADHARQGKFFIWDVWSNGGYGVAGDPNFAVFSPLSFFFGLITGGTTAGFRYYWLLMWWIGGFGVMMLGKHLKATAWGAAIVALGYLFSGIYISNAEHTSFVIGFSFIPLIIWRLDVSLSSERIVPALQAGAIWGLSALSAYVAFTILTGLCCGLWVLGRILFKERFTLQNRRVESYDLTGNKQPSFRFAFISLFLILIIGGLVLSPTYFSYLYENDGTSNRGVLSREKVLVENPLHPGAVSTFASPYIAIQKFYNSNLWAGMDISMGDIYAGAIVTVLALFALVNNRYDKWRWWLLFIALFALACSISQFFPFRGWLYDIVYPTRYFRHPAIFRAYYLFFITPLALIGIRDLALLIYKGSYYSWRNFKISSQILAVSAILVFVTVINSLGTIGGKINLAYVHVFVVWGGICLVPYIANKFYPRQRKVAVPIMLIILATFDAFAFIDYCNQLLLLTTLH